MKLLQRLIGRISNQRADAAQEVVQRILHNYRQRRTKGEWRADEHLFVELSQVLPAEKAREICDRFKRRNVYGDPEAEYLLAFEIVAALHDVQHESAISKPIVVHQAPKPAPDSTPSSAARTCAKVTNGEPLTDADEDAFLFGPWLRD